MMLRQLLLSAVLVSGAAAQVDYLVVTPSYLAPAFDSFAFWRTRCGLRTRVVAIESVLSNAPGRDSAERLRNFVRSAYESLGTRWLLLAGTADLVPMRLVHTPGNLTDFSPCDLYFSDLDGTWDADRDGIFGEENDSVDFYADVFVGRMPVRTVSAVRDVVAKWLRFEQEPARGYLTRLIQAGDTSDLGAPPFWFVAELMPPVGRYQFRDSLEAGFQLVWHLGHADRTRLVLGAQTILDSLDALALGNRDRLFALVSVGSQVAAFDGSCIGSCLLNNADGGAAVVLGNTRAGWISCTPLYRWFFASLFSTESLAVVGRNHGLTKDRFVPFARSDRYWRQSLYLWTLLGDPALRLWTDTAASLDVMHPVVIDTGEQEFPIVVASGGIPRWSLVCLWKDSEVYERRWVDGRGSIPIHPLTGGELLVTVTAANHLTYAGACGVATAVAEQVAAGHEHGRATIVAGVLQMPDASVTGQGRSMSAAGELFNAAGRRVLCLHPGANDISHLAPGVYFMLPAAESRQLMAGRLLVIR